jgi:hypothetical protein
VVSHFTIPAGADGPHSANIDQKGNEFPAAAGELPHPGEIFGIISEEVGVMLADHSRARTRGSNDVLVAGERVEHL